MRRYSHNGVDVSIGVVANQIAMIEPNYALGMKKLSNCFSISIRVKGWLR